MTQPAPVASVFDVDDALLDNDGFVVDLKQRVTRAFATEGEGYCCSGPIRPEAAELHQDLR
ncbi:MAG: hypothetical protein ABR961_12975 [Thermoanaerobaculaceae bacterium]|jgi:hypothetical protein